MAVTLNYFRSISGLYTSDYLQYNRKNYFFANFTHSYEMQQVQCNNTRKIWKFTLIIQLEYSPSLETNFKSSVVRVSCQPKYNNHNNYYNYYYCNNINKHINNNLVILVVLKQ